jgi:hypothetical protein
MAKLLQHRGGTATEHSSFTGSAREVTVDTTNNTLRVHDGSTAGGTQLARLSDVTGTTSVGTLSSLTVSGDATFDTSTLKVDSTNNRVGIGTASPAHDLVVTSASGDATLQILCPTTSDSSQIFFGDSGDENIGVLHYDHSLNAFRFNVNNSEEMRLESDGDLHVDGDVIAFSTTISDVALKSDIEMIPNALDKIDEVRGVTFTRHNGQKSAGIIAQELEKVLPEAVREKELKLVDGKKYKTVEYDAIHGLLINCIKELKEEIKELKNGFTK